MKTTKKKATKKTAAKKSAKTARGPVAPKKMARKKSTAKTAKAAGPLEVQILWGCFAYNASPEDAARTTVLDLAEHLAEGAPIPVVVRDDEGNEYRYEVSAG